jgi:nicotinate-nucleotide pyrophosphorylase
MSESPLPGDLDSIIDLALTEDIGDGDITSLLIPEDHSVKAHIICKENAILCGTPWVSAVYKKIDNSICIDWHFEEGASVEVGDSVASITGQARTILTGERTALNFLQTLSGTATIVREYLIALEGTSTKLLDTRKTLPGLRVAQKYAVRVAGGANHRRGLYDAYLVKENHVKSCGSISKALEEARRLRPDKFLEVEVRNIDEFKEALSLKPNMIMLDNFQLSDMEKAVAINSGSVKLEVSGGIDLDSLANIARTGVDYISIGA